MSRLISRSPIFSLRRFRRLSLIIFADATPQIITPPCHAAYFRGCCAALLSTPRHTVIPYYRWHRVRHYYCRYAAGLFSADIRCHIAARQAPLRHIFC